MEVGTHHTLTPDSKTGEGRRYKFSPMLIYADDILLIGNHGADLQYRLRLVQRTLDVIGLHLNLNKCSILQGHEGERYGVWRERSCHPLSTSERFIFSGIPLGFAVTAEDTLAQKPE